MERIVKCSVCGNTDNCFEEIQDEYSSFMCFNCGFMSDTRFTTENEGKVKPDTTILINRLKYFDEDRKIWWYPSVVNMGKLGIIYPDGTEDDWNWKYAQTIPIPEEKKTALPNYSSMLDTENALTYDRFDFISAIKKMGITKDLSGEKNTVDKS